MIRSCWRPMRCDFAKLRLIKVAVASHVGAKLPGRLELPTLRLEIDWALPAGVRIPSVSLGGVMFARLALFALTVPVACSGVRGLALSSRLGFCSSVPVWFALAALCDKLRAGAASVGWHCVVRRFAVESRARAANGYRVVGGVGRRPCNRERVRENGAARAAQTGAGGCQGERLLRKY